MKWLLMGIMFGCVMFCCTQVRMAKDMRHAIGWSLLGLAFCSFFSAAVQLP